MTKINTSVGQSPEYKPWDFYKKGYSGEATGHWGSTIDATNKGFGGGHARRAIEAGYSPLEIQKWMDANKPAPHESGAASSGQAWNIINPAVQQQKAMESLYSHFNDRFSSMPAPKDWSTELADIKKQGEEGRRLNAEQIQKAMAEAQKVRQNNPYAVVGNQAMGIQQAQSPGQVAGQISAGLAGFSRNQKKFQTKTINV